MNHKSENRDQFLLVGIDMNGLLASEDAPLIQMESNMLPNPDNLEQFRNFKSQFFK